MLSTTVKRMYSLATSHIYQGSSYPFVEPQVAHGRVIRTRTEHEWGKTYSIDSDTDAHDCVRCGEVRTWTLSDGD